MAMLALFATRLSSLRERFNVLTLVAVAVALAGVSRVVPAGETSAPDLLQQQLDAGEFGPALQTARQSGDAAERDARLVRVAAAQAKGGERRAAISTLATVSDDRTRNSALQATSEPAPQPGARGGVQAA